MAIFLAGRTIYQAQFLKSVKDAWNEFNKLPPTNPENGQAVRATFGPVYAQWW